MTSSKKLTEKDFDKLVLTSSGLVMVNFKADWSEPCRLMDPLMEELGRELDGKCTLYTVDVDSQPHLAERFGITSIPAYLIYSQGEVKAQRIGASPILVLTKLVNDALRA